MIFTILSVVFSFDLITNILIQNQQVTGVKFPFGVLE